MTEQLQSHPEVSPPVEIGNPVPFYEYTVLIPVENEENFDQVEFNLNQAIIASGDELQEMDVVNKRFSGYRERRFIEGRGWFLRQSFTRVPMQTYGISSDSELGTKRAVLEEQLHEAYIPFYSFDTFDEEPSDADERALRQAFVPFAEDETIRLLLGVPSLDQDKDTYSGDIDTSAAEKEHFREMMQQVQEKLGSQYNYSEVQVFSYGGRNIAGDAKPYQENVIRIGGKLINQSSGLNELYAAIILMRQERGYMETPRISFNVETPYVREGRSDIINTKRKKETLVRLIRHGKAYNIDPITGEPYIYEQEDVPLADAGIRQGDDIGLYLTETDARSPQAIIASPLRRRTVATAERVRNAFQKWTPPIETDKRLTEVHASKLRGLPVSHFAKMRAHGIPTIFDIPPEADETEFPRPDESREQLVARVADAVGDYVEQYQGGVVDIYTHGDNEYEYLRNLTKDPSLTYPESGGIIEVVFDAERHYKSHKVISEAEVKAVADQVRRQ